MSGIFSVMQHFLILFSPSLNKFSTQSSIYCTSSMYIFSSFYSLCVQTISAPSSMPFPAISTISLPHSHPIISIYLTNKYSNQWLISNPANHLAMTIRWENATIRNNKYKFNNSSIIPCTYIYILKLFFILLSLSSQNTQAGSAHTLDIPAG